MTINSIYKIGCSGIEIGGATKFYLYANDTTIQPETDLVIRDWPGTGRQIEAYNHFLQNGFDTDYALICDIDEFLDGDENFDFADIDADIIYLNWKVFGTCGEKEYRPEPVWKRFPMPAPKDCIYNDTLPSGVTENMHIKSVVKNTNKRMYMVNPHNVICECGVYKNAIGRSVPCSPWQNICWSGAGLNHYITKSEGEFYERRIGKTDACGNRIDNDKLIRWYKNLEECYAK